jgi:NhaP-type Na+/H+ or K+/H+ antiporter
VEIDFPVAALVFGGLLLVTAGLSGVTRGTVLSISILAAGLGIGLSELGVVEVDPASADLRHLAELALILTLFSDGLIVERELLGRHWASPARSLIVALPITLVLIALGGRLFFPQLGWAEAFLLAAVLTPTDPVVSTTVVTAQNVPARIRHALNLESGLNDGLAVPFVLFFLILSSPGGDPGAEAARLAGEAVAGAAIGAMLGYLGGRALPKAPLGGITDHYLGMYGLGMGLATFGLAELTIGNGLIAAFVAGAVLGIAARDLPEEFTSFSEYTSSVAQVVTFFAFGALIVATGYEGSVWALAGLVVFTFLLARPLAVLVASVRSDLALRQRAFIAWFGPKGVASVLFALFVLNSHAPERSLVFDVASFVVLASIVAHGLTDTVASRWIAGEAPAAEPEAEKAGQTSDRRG